MTPRSGRRAAARIRARRPTGFVLRPVRPPDAATLVRLRAALFREMGEVPEPAIAAYEPRYLAWLRRELRGGRLWGYVAEDPATRRPLGGGLLWLQPRTPSARYPRTESPYLFSIYVEPSARQRGIGSAVTEALVELVRRAGYPRVDLFATDVGRPLYERLGFRPTNHMRLDLSRGVASGGRRR